MVDNLEIPGDGLKNLIRNVLHFLIVLYQGQECGDTGPGKMVTNFCKIFIKIEEESRSAFF